MTDLDLIRLLADKLRILIAAYASKNTLDTLDARVLLKVADNRLRDASKFSGMTVEEEVTARRTDTDSAKVFIVRAYVMTVDEYQLQSPQSYFAAYIRGRFSNTEYTHVDVYSPPTYGEDLLYRVKL